MDNPIDLEKFKQEIRQKKLFNEMNDVKFHLIIRNFAKILQKRDYKFADIVSLLTYNTVLHFDVISLSELMHLKDWDSLVSYLQVLFKKEALLIEKAYSTFLKHKLQHKEQEGASQITKTQVKNILEETLETYFPVKKQGTK